MFVVGLTGGIGSGKSEAARMFSELGVPIIDTDVIAHKLTERGSPILKNIIDQFGAEYLLSNNELNRQLLSKAIFANTEKRKRLENILHPEIKKSVEKEIADLNHNTYIIVVIPLLFESSFKDLVDKTLVVDSKESDQIARARKRDGKSSAEIQQIMQHQITRDERLKYADDILVNFGTLAELDMSVKTLHEQYLSADDQ